MATDAVYDFLKSQNRPYSANDVSQNVGKEYGKTEIQKALDKLVQKKMITDKIYGKQKVYFVLQEVVDPKMMNNNLREIDQKINQLTTTLSTVENELLKNGMELKGVQKKKTIAEARVEWNSLTEEVSKLEEKLKSFEGNSEPISEEEKTKITVEHEKYLKEYRKRKRICTDITNAILEGYPKTKKHLFEDIGIETDEDVGFKLS